MNTYSIFAQSRLFSVSSFDFSSFFSTAAAFAVAALIFKVYVAVAEAVFVIAAEAALVENIVVEKFVVSAAEAAEAILILVVYYLEDNAYACDNTYNEEHLEKHFPNRGLFLRLHKHLFESHIFSSIRMLYNLNLLFPVSNIFILLPTYSISQYR